MKPFYLMLPALAVLAASCDNRPAITADYDVVPLPASIVLAENAPGFTMNKNTCIVASDADQQKNAELLAGYIADLTGLNLKVVDKAPGSNFISLENTLGVENPDAYALAVNSDNICINGATPAGTFYGIQTLRKSVPEAGENNVVFPAGEIVDQPRFGYRGAHLDVARHFFGPDSVKIFIDMLALHNINRFHWHLTDDQGWRLEIKSHPLLTEVGSKRSGTVLGANTQEYDSIPYGGFYTQDEVRDIVKYAADRHITVIPEIDMPGHMQAALAAYPSMGCTGGPYEVWRRWGVTDEVLCAGNDSVYKLVDDVLAEVCDLFPSEYIHIGGDECPKVRWEKCTKCQAKIRQLGLKSDKGGTKEQKLQSYFMKHAQDFLAEHGRKTIGWDEILEGGVNPGAVVMSWRGEEGGIAAAKMGHDAIMTPSKYMYFDFVQNEDRDKEPLGASWGKPLTVEKVYSYEPIPETFTPEEAAHIIGVQANTWAEYIPTFSHVQYMTLPRMAALSEVQWSSAPKDYEGFLTRLPQLVEQYKNQGYNYAKHVLPAETAEQPAQDK